MTAWRSRGELNTRNAASEAAHQFRWRKHWRTGWDLNPRCAFACGLKARPHRPLGAPVQCTENGSILRCTRFRLNWRIAEVSIPRPEGPIRFRGGPQPCRVHYPWCGRWGSNPHASRQQGLSLPRLPFRHDRVVLPDARRGIEPLFLLPQTRPTVGGPHRYLVCMARFELARLVEGHQHLKLACLPFHHMHMVCGYGIEPYSRDFQPRAITRLAHHTYWCRSPDLNRDALNGRQVLSLLCLPFHQIGIAAEGICRGILGGGRRDRTFGLTIIGRLLYR